MTRQVRGVLFADYVRMIRSRKDLDWSSLSDVDRASVAAKIDPQAWYPMEVFERLGNAILATMGGGDVDLVRLWGYHSVDALVAREPDLLAAFDPVETLTRFRIMRSTFFDFEALTIPMLHIDEANVIINYGMGPTAEEAASWQTLGFFVRLLELAGATDIDASFTASAWQGADATLLRLTWNP
ncbi:MAG TPA: hypothetical protein VGO62_12780 [Myxococcota bacterium]